MSIIKVTKEHIHEVRMNLLKVITALQVRAWDHDASKLEEPEVSGFAKVTDQLAELTYGSDEYKEQLKQMRPFLNHHYGNNRHHPEHFQYEECNGCFKRYPLHHKTNCDVCGYGQFTVRGGIENMDLVDVIEMLMDWWAATKRHNDGDIMQSIEINQKRFGYSDELKQIFINTIRNLKET